MTNARVPFAKGDPQARELGRLGGKSSGESRRRQAGSDPLAKGLLGYLIGLTTTDWFDRLCLTGDSWRPWRTIRHALDGAPLSEGAAALDPPPPAHAPVPPHP